MKKCLLLLPIVALTLSACDPISERPCGVFDHPDLSLWQPDQGEATIQFMNDEGTSINFTRAAVALNEPFLGSDGASNDEDVICSLSATVRYVSDDNSLAINSVYIQSERSLLEAEDEILAVDHVIEAPANTIIQGSFLADISSDGTRTTLSRSRTLYLDSVEDTEVVGGIAYEDVVRVNAPSFLFVAQADEAGETQIVIVDTTDPEDTETVLVSDFVRQIAIGRQAGLIAFTDGEGREFVRVN